MRVRLDIAYDGTDFAGWQRQAGPARTIQGSLEDALTELAGCAVAVQGAGRTDAGVHAEGQVAAADLETPLAPETLRRALNARLPGDVRVHHCCEVPPGFHPRRDAVGKLYRYRIWNGPDPHPLLRRTTYHVARPLHLDRMRWAAAAWVGRNDFQSFATAGSDPGTTVRRLSALEISGRPGAEVRVEAYGDGFLRHMVRNLVGTLLEFGLGKREPAEARGILEARDRGAAGATAPAKGLLLVRIDYGIP